MVNEQHRLSIRAAALAMLWLMLAPLSGLAASQSELTARAQEMYDSGRYEAVVEVLQPRSAQQVDAHGLLLMGKAYGRLAEQAPWYRAAPLARRCGEFLERAMAADPDNAEAVAALARFLEQAPALIGGDKSRARLLRARLDQLGHSS